ncbi:MAG: glycosyltransferase family 4 protein [Candidatus Binatia bacterium]
MRIVHVVHGFPPESLGGTETYTAQIAAALRQRGHEVSVFTRVADARRTEYAIDTVVRDNITVTRVNNPFRSLNTFTDSYCNLEIARQFGRFLDQTSPDLVHVQHLMYLSTSCIKEAVRRRIPVVMTLHDYWLICQRGRFLKPDLSVCDGQTDDGCARCFAHLFAGKLSSVYQRVKPDPGRHLWLRDLLRRFHARYVALCPPSASARQQINARMAHVRDLCRHVSLFLAPSQFLREQFLSFGVPAEKIVFAECGLPPLETTNGRVREPHDLVRLGYIGVVDPVKGIHLLVDAVASMENVELWIYGGEADYAQYPDRKRFLDQLQHSPHIHMMGRYAHGDLGRILAEVDVVVVPSIWYENAPLVIREAFLAKKPVVTAAFGGMQEWVQNEVNGLLFRPHDVVELRRTLERFVSDPALVGKLSRTFPPVQSIAADALALEERYLTLVRDAR